MERSVKKPDKITRLNEEMWDSRAQTYDRCFGLTHWTQKKLLSLLELEKNTYLLDLACGSGWALNYSASSTKGRGEFYGIDISSKMIEKAEANSANCENVHFSKANADGLPFGNEFFDYIICSYPFHHFSDPDKVVREAYRVLKPHGRIYILDLVADSFLIRLLDRLSKKLEEGHVKIYSTEEYKTFFQRAGFLYMASKSIVFSVKIHIAEKVNGTLEQEKNVHR